MFCKNCGKENDENADFCLECGINLKENKKHIKKLKFNKKTTIGAGALLLVLLCGLLFLIFRQTTPKIEQLKTDFTNEILDDEKFSITEFKIISDTDGKNELYDAIVDVIYDNTKTEYHRQYKLIYKKYSDNWMFIEIENHKKDTWTEQPKISPLISDYMEECKDVLNEISYDVFKPLEEKTIVDLENGKATFYFDTEYKSPVGRLKGEIEFQFEYDFGSEEWDIKKANAIEGYLVETDFLKKWCGSSKPIIEKDIWGKPLDTENFIFEITNYTETDVEAILTFKNEKHTVSGTIDKSSNRSIQSPIYLKDENNKIHIDGYIMDDGTLQVEIDTNYMYGGVSMNGNMARQNIYSLTMTLE